MDEKQTNPPEEVKPRNRAVRKGQVWVRTKQAMAESVDGDVTRVEKGGYLQVTTERARALGDLVEVIEGEPPAEVSK